MQHVLIVGFGKIGAIKARLWVELGAKVYIYDIRTDAAFRSLLAAQQLTLFETAIHDTLPNLIIDISTPASHHVSALDWALKTLVNVPRLILIEKPIVSSPDEKRCLENICNTFADKTGSLPNIIVNESYYESAALHALKRLVQADGNPLLGIDIILSKNRLPDNENGRFFDHELGALGIEMPHMVAILHYLGFNLDTLKKLQAHRYIDQKRNDNQGVVVIGATGGCQINLVSFLGNFTYKNHMLEQNPPVTRTVRAWTKHHQYSLRFDVLDGTKSHHTKLTVTALKNGKQHTELIEDSHLRLHLQQILSAKPKQEYVGIDNSLKICDVLFSWKQREARRDIETVRPSKINKE